ncbi:MAG TPA: tRNA (adenosine(37)-N6)-threonylcarbamoyltransferase complex ATPase subunit type 1 TsaE [Nitrospinota bacterium]|nr:tRNA (adenosine(37)-N6)-threonylcarbamoyltransferase complex ATPase subunit type 1 TsaE [Nitrospinota bacterium]
MKNMFLEAIVLTNSVSMTIEFGKFLGSKLVAGYSVFLNGELGAGKTTFAKGLCTGLGVDKNFHVRSPTFSLINEYRGKLPVRHVDLFRIENEEELQNIGFFDQNFKGVLVIEWANKFNLEHTNDTISIFLDDVDLNSREIKLTARSNLIKTLVELSPLDLKVVNN